MFGYFSMQTVVAAAQIMSLFPGKNKSKKFCFRGDEKSRFSRHFFFFILKRVAG
jgi:hypothetical protein